MSEGERRGNYWGTESISDDLKSQRGVNYMMYNPQLDTFICVVEAGSFSKAAEELYISAPAVITAGALIYNSSAALLKLPASTTQINVSSCGLYIM